MIINPAARLASSLNPMNMPRNVLSVAGDRLRDLIVPDALANAIGAGVGGMGIMWEGIGLPTTFSGDNGTNPDKLPGARDPEKIKAELDDLLAASCPLCEGIVAGLDKPFINGELDKSWQI
jgi:vacuolar protein sorting-associated protein 18